MVYVDPQKARQERERQERERLERERKARLKREADERKRQEKLKAERDRKAKLKAEEDRKAKLKTDPKPREPKSESKSADPKKPIAQKPTETKTDPKPGIVWSKTGQSNPIYGLSASTYGSLSFIHNSITPIAQQPETDLKPFAPLNRNPRTWTGEKAEEPQPELNPHPKADLSNLRAKVAQDKARRVQQQQAPLENILNDPKSTETEKRAARVLSVRLKAASIEKYLPSDRVILFAHLPNAQSTKQSNPLYNQWLNDSKSLLSTEDPQGLEQYYTDNSRTLKTLEWIINAAQNPDQPQSQRFKPYLAPTSDPKDKVELIALKNGSLKELVNKNDPNNKNVWVNDEQIVRAITKTDAQGKPITEYFVPKNGAQVHSLNGSNDSQQQQPPTEWVKITPPTKDQKIVSVDATELTQGKQPTTVKSTLNISGAEQYTHKRYNANSARYADYTNPTFTEYQQLRGDTPRILSGSNLRNEIGMALFNSSLGFVPNNAPKAGTPEAELLKQGKWQGDLFNGTTLPEADKNLSPEQQKQRQEQYKRQQETISKVEEKIKEVGGDNAKVTTLPITVDVTDAKTILQLPLFRVTGKDGKDRFVDENGRLYQDMADWKANNKLPPGRVSYFADGRINDPNEKPKVITENTHAVIDTPGERVKSVADTVLPWLGIAAGAVLLASGLGAPIGAGLIAASTVTMAGVGVYGLSQGIGNYNDRAAHGQSNTDLSDAEVRGMWLGMTADALSMFAVGSALRLGKSGLSVVDDVGRVGKALSVGAQYADTAAIVDSSVTLAQNWDRLTPQQQLASIGQLGFWGMSTGVSAKQAGGLENLYGAKSIRETFGGRGQTTPTALRTEISDNVRTRISQSEGKFQLDYASADLDRVINKGLKLGLDNKTIEDLIFIGSRQKKPIAADELITQMDNYVNVVLKRGYPYRFKDEASYQQFEQDVRTGVQKINLPDADIRFQGSALRNPNAKDIDIAIVVEPQTYRKLITQKFLGRAKENGKPINFENLSERELVDLAKKIELDEINGTKIYNSQARGLKYTILNGKINREDVPGLKKLENELINAYGETDVSVMVNNGELDMKPYLRIE